jgi:hypothetical protein
LSLPALLLSQQAALLLGSGINQRRNRRNKRLERGWNL